MQAVHPGHLIATRFLKPLNISEARLAHDINIPEPELMLFLEGGANLTPELAAKLAAYFQVPASWWLEMQMSWDTWLASRVEPDIRCVAHLDDVLLGPDGPIELDVVEYREPEAIVLSKEQLLSGVGASPRRRSKTVIHRDGSVALEVEI